GVVTMRTAGVLISVSPPRKLLIVVIGRRRRARFRPCRTVFGGLLHRPDRRRATRPEAPIGGLLLALLEVSTIRRYGEGLDRCFMAMHRHRWNIREAGYTLAEMALAMAIIGLMAVLATPTFLRYYQASRLKAAAEEVAAFINQGRQLGIRENVGVCVHITAT